MKIKEVDRLEALQEILEPKAVAQEILEPKAVAQEILEPKAVAQEILGLDLEIKSNR